MTAVEIKDGRIEADVPHRESSLIKQVPGARWHNASLRWRLPLSWASCLALRGVFGGLLTVGPELEKWAWEELEDRINPALGWREVAVQMDYPSPADIKLYPYQYTAANFLVAAGSALLGDEVGTGKTPTTIAALAEMDAWPFLVVCPKSMGQTWKREIEKWTYGAAEVLEGSAAQRTKQFAAWETLGYAKALIVSYDLLRVHSRLAPYGSIALSAKEKTPGLLNSVTWGAVIADEAHRAKDARAKQTRALWAVGDKAGHRFALTGTPIANNVGDLWALLRFVSPEEWPSRTAFLERYCELSYNPWGGAEVVGLKPQTRSEFDRILEPRYLRRTKELVLPHLPAKVYQRRDVDLPPKLAKAYNEMCRGLVAEVRGGTLLAFSPLTQGMRLSQMAAAAVEVDGETVRLVEPSPKLDVLDEVLEELSGLPVVVFAQSRQLLDLASVRLERVGEKFAALVGGQHALERQDAIDGYNSGRVRILLVSLGAGAEGVSLSRGSHCVFLDRSWSAIQNQQAEGRLHGTGRGDKGAESITYIDLVTRGTIEDHRFAVLGDKADALEELVRDKDLLIQALEWGLK